MNRIQVCIGRYAPEHLHLIARRYTYETDLALKIGDVVEVPAGNDNELREATVAALESDYAGGVKKVLRMAK